MHVVSADTLSAEQLPVGALQDSNQSLSAQLESVAKAICKARRVAVVCGAGCSTGAGIPDFRSSTGLFKALKDKHPRAGLTSGKDLFNASLFQSEANTALYYSMIAELCAMSRDAQPTAFHNLLKALDDQGKLFRVYTQNIDALEAKAGLTFGLPPQQSGFASRGKKRKLGSEDQPVTSCSTASSSTTTKTSFKSSIPRCVPLHGSLQSLVCRKCSHSAPLDTPAYLERLAEGQAVPCPSCETAEEVRSVSNFRSRGVGVMKPAVVLYGEPHADADLVGSITASDLRGARPDLLLVVGTTLKVPGTQRLVSELAKVVHPSFTSQGEIDDRPVEKQLSQPKTVFLNAEFPTQAKKWAGLFDVWVQSDIQEFCRVLSDVQTSLAAGTKKKSISSNAAKKQPALSLGIKQVFSTTKPGVASAAGKPPATAARNEKPKVTKAKPKKEPMNKKPVSKAPRPGWDMVLSEDHNMFTSDPVVEGRRPKKAATEKVVNAMLHVRPTPPSPEAFTFESSQASSRASSQELKMTQHSSPSESSTQGDFQSSSQLMPPYNHRHHETPTKPSSAARSSAPSTLSSMSASPSSSEASPSAKDNVKSLAFLTSAEKEEKHSPPRFDSPLQLLSRVSDTKVLPPVSDPSQPPTTRRGSQGLTDPMQYKVSDFFGAIRNQPRQHLAAPAKA